MKRQSHWGEFPDMHKTKQEVKNYFSILPLEKRAKLEMLGPHEEVPEQKSSLKIENHLITQTVELMNHTDRIKSMINKYNEQMVSMAQRHQVLPTITLSPETRACLQELKHPIISPLTSPDTETDFVLGKPVTHPKISKPVALEAICKSLSGLLRVKGFHDCTESSLLMFMDGVDEFYKCLMESINHVLRNEDKDLNKTLDVLTLEKAYLSLTGNSLTSLHNYYKSDIINRNRSEIINFMNTQQEYEKLVEESENIQKIHLKEEYMNMVNNVPPANISPSTSSNQNDSDASSFSYKDSSFSYDNRQQSDDSNNASFSFSQ